MSNFYDEFRSATFHDIVGKKKGENYNSGSDFFLQKLQKSNVFEQINESIQKSKIRASEFGISKLRHFVYKNKTTNQFVYPKYEVPYHEPESQKSLLHLYSQLYQQVNSSQRPLKVIFQQLKTESVLGWVSIFCQFVVRTFFIL